MDRSAPGSRKWILLDLAVFFVFIGFLMALLTTVTQVNIATDSVDYYAILQGITSPKEQPIVRNPHFAEQRSPGYSLLSLVPYGILTIGVEPFVTTEKDEAYEPAESPAQAQGQAGPPEMMSLPPRPLLIKDLFFKDYYVPMEGSWYRWKLALSLLFTSLFFLLAGLWANATVLKMYYPAANGLFIIPAVLLSAPMFLRTVVAMPLFATLTSYGLASLFFLFLCLSLHSNRAGYAVLSGLALGLLVMTRLELSIWVVLFLGYFLMTRRFRHAMLFTLGGFMPLAALIIYNLHFFGTPLHLGIFRGDINRLGFNAPYISDSIIHPQSGVLFWTPLLIPGLVLLFAAKESVLRVIAIFSFVLILFYTLRIPVMYSHIGQGIMNIGGIPVSAPATAAEMRNLICFDINRYALVLVPFSMLGVRIGVDRIWNLLGPRIKAG